MERILSKVSNVAGRLQNSGGLFTLDSSRFLEFEWPVIVAVEVRSSPVFLVSRNLALERKSRTYYYRHYYDYDVFISLKGRDKEKVTEIFHLLASFPNECHSQKPQLHVGLPKGTQGHKPSSDALAGSRIGSREAGIGTGPFFFYTTPVMIYSFLKTFS